MHLLISDSTGGMEGDGDRDGTERGGEKERDTTERNAVNLLSDAKVKWLRIECAVMSAREQRSRYQEGIMSRYVYQAVLGRIASRPEVAVASE